MQDTQELDQTFHFIMETFVKRGDAPHYTEIARKFGVKPDEGNGPRIGLSHEADLMSIFQTPRHSAKYSGNYVSSAPEYAPLFFEKLKEVTGNASFWNPST